MAFVYQTLPLVLLFVLTVESNTFAPSEAPSESPSSSPEHQNHKVSQWIIFGIIMAVVIVGSCLGLLNWLMLRFCCGVKCGGCGFGFGFDFTTTSNNSGADYGGGGGYEVRSYELPGYSGGYGTNE